MDILTDYSNDKKREKVVISKLFKNGREEIELDCNNLQPENSFLNLKEFWVFQINEFAIANSSIKKFQNVVKDTETLKAEKIALRNLNDTKIKKKTLKICKLYRDMLETDDVNKFHYYLNEVEYAHQFIYPALKEVLYDCDVIFRPGESHLQFAAEHTSDDQHLQA